MLTKLLEFNKIKEEFLKELQNYWKDTSVPLEERWAVFVACDFGPTDCCVPYFRCLDDDCIMYEGPVHCDRHQTLMYKDVYESLLEALEDEDYKDRIFSSPDYTLDDWREEVLADGTIGFEYDW